MAIDSNGVDRFVTGAIPEAVARNAELIGYFVTGSVSIIVAAIIGQLLFRAFFGRTVRRLNEDLDKVADLRANNAMERAQYEILVEGRRKDLAILEGSNERDSR